MGMRHCAVYDTWSVYHIGPLIMRLILHQNTLKPQTDNFLLLHYAIITVAWQLARKRTQYGEEHITACEC